MIKIKIFVFSNSKKINNESNVEKVKTKISSLGLQITESMSDCDIVVVVGGDGTTLHIARKASLLDKPVLGINFGRVGFISSIEKDELDLLEKLLDEKYSIEQKSMLEVHVGDQSFLALNDTVISKGSLSKMIDIEVECNKKKVSKYRADGIIIATPTGSTAYSLSAGGAVIDPQIKCMMITPICPHMKFSCPIVIGAQNEIQVKSFSRNEKVFVCIDGEKVASISDEDVVSISVSKVFAKFIKIKEKLFFETLNSKLNFISNNLF